jgi:hypothetical protein
MYINLGKRENKKGKPAYFMYIVINMKIILYIKVKKKKKEDY